MADQPDLVTVVVPAHDAARTLDETLRSVRAQTHRNLEILVVDDGSRDATPDIARRHADEDPRLRLIRQPNGGVASARNRGIAEARAEFVAPVDADDLWRADKIARQLAVLRAGGEAMGLVYDWYALIDADSRILATDRRPTAEGDVLRAMCRGNLPGNGSSALMRRAAVLEAGGYDASLRARGAQGCEDWQLHLRLAARWRFGLVRDFCTGYRMTPASMSGDGLQMLRSCDIVVEEARQAHPGCAAELHEGRLGQLCWLAARAAQGGRLREAAILSAALLRHDAGRGAAFLALLGGSLARRRLRRAFSARRAAPPRPRFPIGEVAIPESAIGADGSTDRSLPP